MKTAVFLGIATVLAVSLLLGLYFGYQLYAHGHKLTSADFATGLCALFVLGGLAGASFTVFAFGVR